MAALTLAYNIPDLCLIKGVCLESFSKYISTKLDKIYSEEPGDIVERNELPSEEFEVREALMAHLFYWGQLSEMSIWYRLFERKHSSEVKRKFFVTEARLIELINKSPEHRAAMYRILSLMPEESESSKFYSQLLDKSKFKA